MVEDQHYAGQVNSSRPIGSSWTEEGAKDKRLGHSPAGPNVTNERIHEPHSSIFLASKAAFKMPLISQERFQWDQVSREELSCF